METMDALLTRRSCRSYTNEPVSKEDLEKIAKAGTYAATGMGKQSPVILVVTDKELRDKLSKMNAAVMGAQMDPFYGAPVVMVVLANKAIPTHVNDGSLVIGNMMLAAHDLGLGSCWIHRAKEVFATEEGKEILKKLGVEEDVEGVGNMIVGHPTGEFRPALPRKENYVIFAD